MCGRYSLSKPAADIAKHFNLATVPQGITSNFNVAPSQTMPVVTEREDGSRQLEFMKWGIPRRLGKDSVKELINTRSDKAFTGFWKKTVCNHRCLVPADGFYEWRATSAGKVPYFVQSAKGDMCVFAGIWDVWQAEDGQEIKVYSIMTTDSNKEMRAVHARMPVVLDAADEAAWLKMSNDTPELLGGVLLAASGDNRLTLHQVSRDVNNPRNNAATLLLPVA